MLEFQGVFSQNEAGREGASTPVPALDIATPVEEVRTMPDARHYLDSAHSRNPEKSDNKGPIGSTLWKASVVRQLRGGGGVEDIALRMGCPVEPVRALVADLRRYGLLPKLYDDARKNWQSIGSIAARLSQRSGGAS